MQTCVASHNRGEEALLSHLSLMNTKYSGEFPGCDSSVVWNMTVSLVQAPQLLMGGPIAGDVSTLPCYFSGDVNCLAQLLTMLLSTAMTP
jgi:hypothetical protein